MKRSQSKKPAHPRPFVKGYRRETAPKAYAIVCGLCGQAATAHRYPGGAPSICDGCFAEYRTPGAARVALWRKNNKG